MYFVVTIDTEEDQWSDYTRQGSVDNIKELPRLQSLFDKYGVKPTYLITYRVADSSDSVAILKDVTSGGRGTVGAHCHPWNTPPFVEELSAHSSMLCNLDDSVQYQKIKVLTELIGDRFGSNPKSFRAGRWGYGTGVSKALGALGYSVDTSLSPYMDWTCYGGPDFYNCPTTPYFFEPDSPFSPVVDGGILEVPVSIGFSRRPFHFWDMYSRIADKSKISKKLLCGSLSRLGFMTKIWLSPEMSTAEEMICLIDILRYKEDTVLNLMFHSNTLMAGKTPFVKNPDELSEFYSRLSRVFEYAAELGCKFLTLDDFIEEKSVSL